MNSIPKVIVILLCKIILHLKFFLDINNLKFYWIITPNRRDFFSIYLKFSKQLFQKWLRFFSDGRKGDFLASTSSFPHSPQKYWISYFKCRIYARY